jgi:hypothetical protein
MGNRREEEGRREGARLVVLVSGDDEKQQDFLFHLSRRLVAQAESAYGIFRGRVRVVAAAQALSPGIECVLGNAQQRRARLRWYE